VGPRSDLGSVNKEIFPVGAFRRPQLHWPLSRRLVSAYWALRNQSFISTWKKTLWKLSHRWEIFVT